MVPGLAVAAFLISGSYEREREKLDHDMIQTARALALAVDYDLAASQAALEVLAASPFLASRDLAAFYRQAREVVPGHGDTLVLADESGQQVLNLLRPLGEPLPRHGNPEQVRRVFESGKPAVSDLFTGMVLGRPLVTLDLPVLRDGKVLYAMSLGMRPQRFNRILAEHHLPDGWIAAIFDRSGVIVARTHDPDAFIGRKGTPILVERMQANDEGLSVNNTLEGIPVYGAFSRSVLSRWSVAVGVPRAVLLGELRGHILFVALISFALLTTGLGLAWIAGGRIARAIQALMPKAPAAGQAGSSTLPQLRVKETAEVAMALWERRQIEAETLLAASVFENTAEGIVITDADAAIIMVNRAFSQLTGYAPDEVTGQKPGLLRSDRHDEAFYRTLWACVLSRGKWQGEIWDRRKSGEAFVAWVTITAVYDRSGHAGRFIMLLNDITELHVKTEELRYQAYHDALTGLPNRTLLQDRLAQAIEIARRNDTLVALLFIDLDRFKMVNDSLGHDVGDALLTEAAARLTGCLRRSDTLSRLGGDEFVAILGGVHGSAEVVEVAGKIGAALSMPMTLAGHEVTVGASIGIALFPQDGGDVTALMKNADTAMYRAKDAGRNTFRFFDATMNEAALDRLRLDMALRRALERDEFELYYQPKIDLHTRRVLGVEALLRWNSGERGLVPPAMFIPAAEETGAIGRIGDWVIRSACRQLNRWSEQGLNWLPVAVNVSARQFLDSSFAERLTAELASQNIDPARFEIELTESTIMADPENAIAQLQRLRALGVVVSVDDFGTGYSSLSYLKRLPLSGIKVDRAFVHDVHLDLDNAAIVDAITKLAGALGMAVIAEGVETAAEEHHLKTNGCSVAQGFLYSRPLPAAEFERWLAEFTASSAAAAGSERRPMPMPM